MKEQMAFQNFLRKKLLEAQKKNSNFSLRSFSKKTGVHVGALSSILNGKRNVSKKLAERITRHLLLDPVERSEVLSLFPEKRKRIEVSDDGVVHPKYLLLNASQHKIMAEWEYYAVLSLLRCDDFQSDVEWISKRLGISLHKTKQILDTLLDLNLLQKDENQNLKRTNQSLRSKDDVADIALKKHNLESLELASESVTRDAVEDRDMSTMTMAINPKKISTAKELIRKFQDELSEMLEDGKKTEVYRLSVQLFPLTLLQNALGEKS